MFQGIQTNCSRLYMSEPIIVIGQVVTDQKKNTESFYVLCDLNLGTAIPVGIFVMYKFPGQFQKICEFHGLTLCKVLKNCTENF